MTIPEFLDALKTIDGWYLTSTGRIRCKGVAVYAMCPLTAPFGLDAHRAQEAARRLGVNDDDRYYIIVAADNFSDSFCFDPALRQQLLAVTVHRP